MTKAELVAEVAEKAELTKKDSEAAIGALVGAITQALKKGDKLTLVNFGTFSISKRAARQGQNPQTGKKIKIAAANVPKFKAGKGLKDAVNSKK